MFRLLFDLFSIVHQVIIIIIEELLLLPVVEEIIMEEVVVRIYVQLVIYLNLHHPHDPEVVAVKISL